MPSLTISWGVRPTISRPSRRTIPAVGFCTPVMMLNKVLFPAPLAPISPTISPCSIANEISLKATRPPKSMVTPRTSSRAKATPPLHYRLKDLAVEISPSSYPDPCAARRIHKYRPSTKAKGSKNVRGDTSHKSRWSNNRRDDDSGIQDKTSKAPASTRNARVRGRAENLECKHREASSPHSQVHWGRGHRALGSRTSCTASTSLGKTTCSYQSRAVAIASLG